MKTLSSAGCSLLLVKLLCFVPMTLADDQLTFMAGASVGIRAVEFDLDARGSGTFFILDDANGIITRGTSGTDVAFGFDEDLYTASFTGTMIYGRFNASISGETPLREEDTELRVQFSARDEPGLPVQGDDNRDSTLDRIDYSLTLGYRVWEGFSVFSGYKYTEFDVGSEEYNFLLVNKDQNYVEEGFFIGASHGWQFGTVGGLSLSIAYAYLDAEFSESNVSPEPGEGGVGFGEFVYSGNSAGLSLGAQWSGRLTGQWLYTLGIKYQSYTSNNNTTLLQTTIDDSFLSGDPDVSIPITSSPITVSNIDTEHTDTTFSLGVLYRF